MAETHPLPADMAEELKVESHAPYMKVWAVLAILTGLEYFYALFFKDHFPLLLAGLLTMALVKAGLVGWYFMHLKFEKKWVYLLIVPACILAVLVTMALVPDMAMKPTEDEEGPAEEAWVVPPSGRDGIRAVPRMALLEPLSDKVGRPGRSEQST